VRVQGACYSEGNFLPLLNKDTPQRRTVRGKGSCLLYTFGDCVLDTNLFAVQRAGQRRHLRPKVFQLLLYLVVHRDRVISKQELSEQVWAGRFISDATLESHIRLVRQAVGDSGRAQCLIQTLYGHGYRFIGAVEEHGAAESATVALATPALSPPMTAPDDEAAAPDGAAPHRRERVALPSAAPAATVALGADLGPPAHRQLTVLMCGLVEATALAMSLDPEALHTVLSASRTSWKKVVEGFAGYVAQDWGESLVVYFGWPRAHEDDAHRAVQAGLALIDALEQGQSQAAATRVRVGIHTSPVIVGASTPAARLAAVATGEAPQLAAQLMRRAAPQTVVLSAATWRLVAGWFVGEALEAQPFPGIPQPVPVYRVLRVRGAQSRFEAVWPAWLTHWAGVRRKWPSCGSVGPRPWTG
jgi:class 3 adenylate cyclase/DNA-binding winged helix-turn-helix (wHTH) protein